MIDEKKLIKEIDRLREKYDEMCGAAQMNEDYGMEMMYAGKVTGLHEIKKFIMNQPKVSGWIPCGERLPVESGTYIVNAIENGIIHVTFAKWMPRMKTWNLTGSRSYWKVNAWQPLPEPYKGE